MHISNPRDPEFQSFEEPLGARSGKEIVQIVVCVSCIVFKDARLSIQLAAFDFTVVVDVEPALCLVIVVTFITLLLGSCLCS